MRGAATRRIRALAGALVVTACSLGPDDVPLTPALPAGWDAAAPAVATAAVDPGDVWPSAGWWRGFGSVELDRLIDGAQAANLDLAIALSRIRQAEAQSRIAGAALLPSASAGAGAGRTWTERGGGSRGGTGGGNDTTVSDSVQASFTARYQADLFGATAASAEAAALRLQASRYDRETVALTLHAEVALTYFEVLALRDRLRLAQETLRIAGAVLTVLTAQVGAGAASDLELAQQRSSIAQQRAAIPALEQAEREALGSLALLLGRPPQGFTVSGRSLSDLRLPAVAPGLPAALLQRRPDIRQAEALVRAATRDIRAARAARFPDLSLNLPAGVQSAALSSLITTPTAVYSLASSITAPLFEGGRLEAQEDLSAARREELVNQYAIAVLAALNDTGTALSAVDTAARRLSFAREAQDQARQALRIINARFGSGTVDFLTVLDAQRSLFQADDTVTQADLARYSAATALFRALGGGWNGALAPLPAATR